MKRLSGYKAGFTILEIMIFLIVSGSLIIGALALFSGRIARTQFNQSVQELDNKIKGTINEVATGTYPPSPFFTCAPDGTGVPIVTSAASNTQGSNSGCVFLGKVMQFGVAGQDGCTSTTLSKCTNVNIYTMVGRRVQATGSEVTGLSSSGTGAYPRLVNNTSPYSTGVNLTEFEKLSGGTSVYNVKNVTSNTPVGAVAITQSVASYTTSGSISRVNTGAQVLQTWPVATAFPRTQAQIGAAVATSSTFLPASQDPAGGIVVCVQGGTNQRASITIGVNDGRVATKVFMGEDPACA